MCSPSRTSLLTGRRPDTTRVVNLETFFRDIGGDFTTLPQYFKQHGYRSINVGKIFHPTPTGKGSLKICQPPLSPNSLFTVVD